MMAWAGAVASATQPPAVKCAASAAWRNRQIPWTKKDRIHRPTTQGIPNKVAIDTTYQKAKQNPDRQNARIEHEKALACVPMAVLKDDTEALKRFSDNESFRRWPTDTIFSMTYDAPRPDAL